MPDAAALLKIERLPDGGPLAGAVVWVRGVLGGGRTVRCGPD